MAANLKEVRERIKSVVNTQQITKAMKMVSAAKLRKAQQAIVQMRPYSSKLNDILSHVVASLAGDAEFKLAKQREVKGALLVAVTASRGLCGAFNTNILKSAVAAIKGPLAATRKSGTLSILCIGKKGADYFKKYYNDCNIITEYVPLIEIIKPEAINKMVESIIRSFEQGNYDSVHVAYGKFKNAATQFPTLEAYLPVPKISLPAGKTKMKADYIFEPDKQTVLESLIPALLKIQMKRFILETSASEHGARMTAMDKATENAEELIKELRIHYNRARQETITKELLEIVAGAAALNG
ncbi:MAG: ATP synthase F1 subunit gamma [Saprospiraceae bacterium]